MKRALAGLIISVMTITAVQTTYAAESKENIVINYKGIDMSIDEESRIITSNEPFIYKNTVYAPLRETIEAMGYKVVWDNNENIIHLEENYKKALQNQELTKVRFHGLEFEIPKEWQEDCETIDTRWLDFDSGYMLLNFVGGETADLFLGHWKTGTKWLEYTVKDVVDYNVSKQMILGQDSYIIEYKIPPELKYESPYMTNRLVIIDTQGGVVLFSYHSAADVPSHVEREKQFYELLDGLVSRPNKEEIQVVYKDFKILLDAQYLDIGKEFFIYKDRIYIPIRAIAEVLDKEVEWDSENSIVKIISKPSAGGLVFNLPEGEVLQYDEEGFFKYDLEHGIVIILYDKNDSDKFYFGEGYKDYLEKDKQRASEGTIFKVIDYQYTQFNDRDYLIVKYEGYLDDDFGGAFGDIIKMPEAIIMEAKVGTVTTMYLARDEEFLDDLEFYEKMMFDAILK